MFRRTSQISVAAAIALAPALLLAGGPARLSLPIEGVTAETADACAKLLTSGLEDKVLTYEESPGVQIVERGDQWYAAFAMGDDVRLSDIDAALKGSDFSVSRERLRLFGHVVLEIESGDAQSKALRANLDSLEFVSVAESEGKDGRFQVTIDMPYPTELIDSRRELAGFAQFRWNNLASVATTTAAVAGAAELPTVEAIDEIVARHKARLTDVRWSAEHACRPLGGVAASEADVVAAGVSRTQYSVQP
jgi:hypothetical protein